MVSDKMMKRYLENMSTNPQPLYVIAKRLNRSEGTVRFVLNAMLDLGLVEKVPLHKEGRGDRPISVGWRKRLLG
jgi:predicted transcriptional regulator